MKAALQQARNAAAWQHYASDPQNPTPEDGMKVKLLTRKGSNKPGSVVEYDTVSAEWLIDQGHAEPVKAKGGSETGAPDNGDDSGDTAAKPARRGRPRKDA